EERGLELAAALSGEPCFWTPGDARRPAARPYYTGTTGKVMPMVLAVGKRSHVGCYYEGVSAALLASLAVAQIEADPGLIEGAGDDVLGPPACLQLQVRRKVYSVTLPERAVAYFNVLTASKSPQDVLGRVLEAARRAARLAKAQLDASAAAFRARGGCAPVQPEARVLTVAELRAMALEASGSEEALAAFVAGATADLASGADAREASVRHAEALAAAARLAGPALVVGFVPPYYPHRRNRRRTAGERRMRAALEAMAARAGELAGDGAVLVHEIFSGICDLSFLGFEGRREELEALAANTPAWGEAYSLPMDELLRLDVPVANMGPAGRDAHQPTERLELGFSFEVAPRLLMETIALLAAPDDEAPL
ncbi:MAG: RocB protein, partial [Duodenibacillus sp.]|nr:RocB protein [Duodenibacillus sp.]